VSLKDFLAVVRMLKEADPFPELYLFTLPVERAYYLKLGWIAVQPDGRTLTTGRGPWVGGIPVRDYLPMPVPPPGT
jgi:hypothetical protein